MPDDTSFVWPAAGAMQVTALPGGGCNIKISIPHKGIVRSIGKGRITKIRNIPSRRIAQQYDITIRHDDDFESNYNIVDQTPHSAAATTDHLRSLGPHVEDGGELYTIRDGGCLNFQLFRAGKLVDPRDYIKGELDVESAASDR